MLCFTFRRDYWARVKVGTQPAYSRICRKRTSVLLRGNQSGSQEFEHSQYRTFWQLRCWKEQHIEASKWRSSRWCNRTFDVDSGADFTERARRLNSQSSHHPNQPNSARNRKTTSISGRTQKNSGITFSKNRRFQPEGSADHRYRNGHSRFDYFHAYRMDWRNYFQVTFRRRLGSLGSPHRRRNICPRLVSNELCAAWPN